MSPDSVPQTDRRELPTPPPLASSASDVQAPAQDHPLAVRSISPASGGTESPLPPLLATGFFGRLRRSVATLLAPRFPRLAAYLLDVTGAGAGDRLYVANRAMQEEVPNQDPASIPEKLAQFRLEPREAAEAAAFESPLKAYTILTNCSPHEERARRFLFLSKALAKGESGALSAVTPELAASPEELAQIWQGAVSSSPLEALRHRSRFGVVPDSAVRDTITRAVQENPLQFLRSVSSIQLPLELKQHAIQTLFAADPVNTLEMLDDVLTWSEKTLRIPPFVDKEILNRFWLRILTHRETLGISDEAAVREMALEKARTHSTKFLKHLDALHLAHTPFANELARILSAEAPESVPVIKDKLGITDAATLNALACSYATAQPRMAQKWVTQAGVEATPETLRHITLRIAEASPWRGVAELLQAEVIEIAPLMRLVTLAAKANSAQVAREIDTLPILPEAVRAHAFVECAKKSLWPTLEQFEKFGVASTPAAESVVRQAAARDPLRALPYVEKLQLTSPTLRRELLLLAVAKSAQKTVEGLSSMRYPEATAAEVLVRALRRNHRLEREALPLLRRLSDVNATEALAAMTDGDLRRGAELLGQLQRGGEARALLFSASVIENFRRAKATAGEAQSAAFKNEEALTQMAAAAILRGRWNSALEIGRELAGLRAKPDEAVTTTETLTLLDGLAAAQAARDDLSSREQDALTLFQRIRKAHCIPTDLIKREAKKFTQHFGDLRQRYVMYLSKSKSAYFGRAGAGLCTAEESWSWNSPTFLQMMLVDTQRSRIVGNVQLHLFTATDRTPSILARLNPTSSFLNEVEKQKLADEMLRVVRQFAADNSLRPYLPLPTSWHELTNRDPFIPPLRRHFIGPAEPVKAQITAYRNVSEAYRI